MTTRRRTVTTKTMATPLKRPRYPPPIHLLSSILVLISLRLHLNNRTVTFRKTSQIASRQCTYPTLSQFYYRLQFAIFTRGQCLRRTFTVYQWRYSKYIDPIKRNRKVSQSLEISIISSRKGNIYIIFLIILNSLYCNIKYYVRISM